MDLQEAREKLALAEKQYDAALKLADTEKARGDALAQANSAQGEAIAKLQSAIASLDKATLVLEQQVAKEQRRAERNKRLGWLGAAAAFALGVMVTQ